MDLELLRLNFSSLKTFSRVFTPGNGPKNDNGLLTPGSGPKHDNGLFTPGSGPKHDNGLFTLEMGPNMIPDYLPWKWAQT